jgi:hypothetical protein
MDIVRDMTIDRPEIAVLVQEIRSRGLAGCKYLSYSAAMEIAKNKPNNGDENRARHLRRS